MAAVPPTFASDSATITYTPEGRVATVTTASGATITYTYDAAGNITNRTAICGAGTSTTYGNGVHAC